MTGERVERRLAADVAGYSRLMGANEEGTLARLKAVRKTLVDPTIAAHRGRIVKTTGDGMLVEFGSAVDATRCAVEFQRSMATQNDGVPRDNLIQFRIGIHVGDIIFDDNDIFGDGVNIAARLEGIADAGGVCLSDDTHRQIRGKVEIACEDMGPQALKNIAEPVRAWRIRLDAEPAARSSLPAAAPRAPDDMPSIAVLPFTNMSSDSEQEYLADGITEDIITELSRLRGLLVIARNSTFSYKGQSVDIKKVAAELGVKYVLEGSVRRSGSRVRFTAQLIDAQTGGHVWAERYDREIADIFELQDEITRSVVGTLQMQIVFREGSLAPRATVLDFEIWSQSKKVWNNFYGLSRKSLTEARRMAQAMVEHHPDSAEGHKLLSLVTTHLVMMGFAADADALKSEAYLAAQTALSIDANDEHSHWALGLALGFFQNRIGEAEAALTRSIEINPNFSVGYGSLGSMLAYAGRANESIERTEYAIRLNPRDPSIFFRYSSLAVSYFNLSDYEQARKWARLSVERNAEWWVAAAILAASLSILGQMHEATDAARLLLQISPNLSLRKLPIEPVRPAAAKQLFYDALAGLGVPW